MSEKRSDGAYVRIYNRKEFIMAMTLHMNTDETIDAIIAADRKANVSQNKCDFNEGDLLAISSCCKNLDDYIELITRNTQNHHVKFDTNIVPTLRYNDLVQEMKQARILLKYFWDRENERDVK